MARTLIDVWKEGGDAWLAVVFHPRDRVSGDARTVLFTDAPALYTTPEETPPNARFVPRLMPTWRLKRALAASGALTGPSSIESANFDLENGDGSLTSLKGLVWSNQPFEVYMGSPRGPAGEVLTFSDFIRLFSGVTRECRGGSVLSIAALGRKASLDNPLVQDYYRGFGMGVLIPEDEFSYMQGAASAYHNVTGACTMEWIGRLTGTHFGTDWRRIFTLTNFCGLIMDLAGHVGFITGTSDSDISSIQWSSYIPPTGVDLYLAAVVAADGVSVTLYAREWPARADQGFRPGSLAVVAELTMPVPLSKTSPSAGAVMFGRRGAHVYEARLRSAALTYDELLVASERPLPAGGAGVSDLMDLWRLGEAEGVVALSDLQHVDLDLTGDVTWLPSLDGDDPAVFAGGPLGQTKPTCFGPCLHLPLVLLDSQTKTYGWRGPDLGTGVGPSSDLWGRLRANGAPMIPDETISLGDGTIGFGFDDPHVISLSGLDSVTGLSMTAKRLIPGQLSPARDGQRIVVTGSVSSDGTYTIDQDGVGGQPAISPDGLNIRVVESIVSEIVVGPAAVTIRTLAADRQYTYDLTNSTVVIASNEQAGAFGIDVAGGAETEYLAADLFAVLSDGAVDSTALLWNPPLALGHLVNSTNSRKAALDAVALSAMAWWVEDEEGVYRLSTIRPSVGAPARRFRELILSVRSVASTDPFSKITVGYAKNHLVLDPGVIPGSVPANDRTRLSAEYLLAPRSATAATLSAFPQAKPRTDPFPTYLIDAANAETWLDYAAPMFLEERLWWEITLAGAWVAAIVKPGDEHEFVYSPPTGTFETGASARVMSVAVDKGSDRTILEVVT